VQHANASVSLTKLALLKTQHKNDQTNKQPKTLPGTNKKNSLAYFQS